MRLSPYLLIILIMLLIVGACNGQVTIKSEELKTDTTIVDLLWTRNNVSNDYPKIMRAYEVLKITSDTVIWFYLDRNKKPLDKRINVWMSKPIKP